MNTSFHSLSQSYPSVNDESSIPEVTEILIQSLQAKLNPSKACGPDKILNWLLKEYADLLSFPVCKIINASLRAQQADLKAGRRFAVPKEKASDGP